MYYILFSPLRIKHKVDESQSLKNFNRGAQKQNALSFRHGAIGYRPGQPDRRHEQDNIAHQRIPYGQSAMGGSIGKTATRDIESANQRLRKRYHESSQHRAYQYRSLPMPFGEHQRNSACQFDHRQDKREHSSRQVGEHVIGKDRLKEKSRVLYLGPSRPDKHSPDHYTRRQTSSKKPPPHRSSSGSGKKTIRCSS